MLKYCQLIVMTVSIPILVDVDKASLQEEIKRINLLSQLTASEYLDIDMCIDTEAPHTGDGILQLIQLDDDEEEDDDEDEAYKKWAWYTEVTLKMGFQNRKIPPAVISRMMALQKRRILQ